MRKTLAISLMCLHLFGNTEMGQILKVPQLLHHFFQHHRQNPDIGFLDFLEMHYAGDDGISADDDIDSSLPYHSPNSGTFFSLYSPLASEILMTDTNSDLLVCKFDYIPQGHSSKHVLLILQPPRFS